MVVTIPIVSYYDSRSELGEATLEIPWFDYPKMYPWEYLRWLLVYCYIPWKLQLSIAHKVLPQIVVFYTTHEL